MSNVVPWAERLPVALWRGGPMGLFGRRRGSKWWESLPRCRLAALANTPEADGLIDAGISTFASLPAETVAAIRAAGLVRNFIPATSFNHYRYNIDIDGNSNAWAGLLQKLCTGSVVLKVDSPYGYRQWYYHRLVPWVHFVPVESDLSDLIEKVKWLQAHDDQAQEIGARGQELAMSMTLDAEMEQAVPTIAEGVRYQNGRENAALNVG